MRKSKMMKALLVFGMSVVTATAMVGFTACDSGSGTGTGDGGDEGPSGGDTTCEHKYTGTYTDGYLADANQHWHLCDTCDQEADRADHKDNDGNGKCDTCGYELNHTFDTTKWEKDNNSHWHPATCGCTQEKGDEAAHVDADADGACDVGCGFTYTIPAEFSALRTKEGATVLVADTFLSSTAKLPTFGGTYGTAAGVYTRTNNPDGDAQNYTKVENGATVMVDGTAKATQTIVDFGAVTPGVVEGYFEMTLSEAANSWTPVQFIGVSAAKTDDEVIGFRTDGGKIKYRVDGGSALSAAGDVSTSTDTMKVSFSFDLINKKATIKIGETVLANDISTTITEIKGIRFTSSDSNARVISIDNLVVVNTPASVEEYKPIITAKITAAKAEMNADITVDDSTADYKTAYDTAIAAADSIAACDAAYDAYYAGLLTAYKAKVKPQLQVTYPAENYTGENNKPEYEAVMGTAENDVIAGKLETADTIAKVTKVYTDAVAALDVIHADGVTTFTVTIHDGESTYSLENLSANDNVTEAMLNTKIGLASGKAATYYTDSEHNTKLTLPTKFSGATDIYVVVEDVKVFTFTLASKAATCPQGYDVSGWSFTSNKTSVSYSLPGIDDPFTSGAKLDSSGSLTINLTKAATVKFYFYAANTADAKRTLKFDDGAAVSSTAVPDTDASAQLYYIEQSLSAGQHVIKRGSDKEIDIFYIVVSE